MDPLIFSVKEIVRFGIVLMRLGGVILLAPLFSSLSIPFQAKIIIVLVSALGVAPSVPLSMIPDDFGLATLLTCALNQVLLGMVLGLAGAVGASQAVAAMLFGVSRLDPMTYIGVIAMLAGVSAIACSVPAWRAARIDPMVELRYE